MIKDSTIQVRIDSKTKREAQIALKKAGLDLSGAVKLFLVQVVRRKSIPFPIVTENGYAPSYERMVLRDVAELKRGLAKGKVRKYKNARELFIDTLGKNYDKKNRSAK